MAWPVNARTSAMMDEAQSLYGSTITATQGSPSGSVSASAGTHDGEGVIDVVGADLDAIVAAMRQVGFAAWHRTTAQGFTPHVHGVAVGEPLLSPQAATQVQSYFSGHNGLRGNGLDDGPRDWVGVTWETYTGGTYVPPTGGDPAFVYDQFPGDRAGMYTFDPGGILAGAPYFTYSGAPVAFNRFRMSTIDTVPSPLTLHMTAGDSIASAPLYDWTYEFFESLTRGYWILRATGDAVLEVSDAYDDDFEYPSGSQTWTPRELVGSDGEFLYYQWDPTLLDGDHLGYFGQMLSRITCVTGSAEITFIGMQVEQAQGFFVTEGYFWSDVHPAATREPEDTSDTYDTTTVGAVTYWVVDAQPVLGPDTGGGGPFVDWRGAGESFADGQSAIDAANVDFHPHGSANGPTARVSLHHDTVTGIWTADIREAVDFTATPSKSTLDDALPAAYYTLWAFQAGDFEWTDTDSYFLGWLQLTHTPDTDYDHYLETQGDGDTVSYSVFTSATGGEDLSSGWFTTGGGQVIISGTTTDTFAGTPDPGGIPDGPAQILIPETFISTSDQLIYQRLELSRRFTDFENQFTPDGGYIGGLEGTDARLAVRRASDNSPISVRQIAARFRVPPWRYQIPTFRSSPGPVPTIDFDEDPSVRYLRNRQRNDGLGGWSTPRTKGTSSRQLSLHNRGYE